ncbi:hypothetical protein Tco_0695290 [Tanacetum coccineum]
MVQMTISLTSMNANKLLMSVQGFKEFSSDEQVMTSDHNSSELEIHDHNNELSSSKLVPKVVPPADKTATSRQELELLFHHHISMLSELQYAKPFPAIQVSLQKKLCLICHGRYSRTSMDFLHPS